MNVAHLMTKWSQSKTKGRGPLGDLGWNDPDYIQPIGHRYNTRSKENKKLYRVLMTFRCKIFLQNILFKTLLWVGGGSKLSFFLLIFTPWRSFEWFMIFGTNKLHIRCFELKQFKCNIFLKYIEIWPAENQPKIDFPGIEGLAVSWRLVSRQPFWHISMPLGNSLGRWEL